jgi:hypothetical protein
MKRMSDVSDIEHPEPFRSPRCSVQFDSDGTWSAWRGAILLASGLPTVTAAWDVIDRAVPMRSSTSGQNDQRSGPSRAREGRNFR